MINKPIVLTIALFLFTGLVFAQPYGKPQQHLNHKHHKHHKNKASMQRLAKHLELTHTQKLHFKVIFKEQHKVRMALMKKHRVDTDNRLNSVLTPAQQQKFVALKEKRKERRQENCGKKSVRK